MQEYDQHPNRPWQGTFIGVLNIIGVVFSLLIAVIFIVALAFGATFIEPYLDSFNWPITLGITTLLIVLLAVIIPVSILYIFVTLGIFKGAKWAVIVNLIFSILSVTGTLISFNFFGLAIQVLIIYCCIVCLGNPYYNRKVLL